MGETIRGNNQDLEGESMYTPRGGNFTDYRGPLWRFVQDKVSHAYVSNMSAIDAGNEWHSGAFLLETVPSVLYILMRHAQDPEEAIVRAVNDTKGNDTVAAIVGAAVGALHGKDTLPNRLHIPGASSLWIRFSASGNSGCSRAPNMISASA